MNVFCVGLSHHTANVETRERFGRSLETERLLRENGCAEALVLDTCNRVEVYGATERELPTSEVARCVARNLDSDVSQDAATFYRHENGECAQHLFRVVSGLDSMVVGETEVLGQAKKAYEAARALARRGRTFIGCFSGPSGLRSKCEQIRRSPGVRFRLGRWLPN